MNPDDIIDRIENTARGFIVTYRSGRETRPFLSLDDAVKAHKVSRCRP